MPYSCVLSLPHIPGKSCWSQIQNPRSPEWLPPDRFASWSHLSWLCIPRMHLPEFHRWNPSYLPDYPWYRCRNTYTLSASSPFPSERCSAAVFWKYWTSAPGTGDWYNRNQKWLCFGRQRMYCQAPPKSFPGSAPACIPWSYLHWRKWYSNWNPPPASPHNTGSAVFPCWRSAGLRSTWPAGSTGEASGNPDKSCWSPQTRWYLCVPLHVGSSFRHNPWASLPPVPREAWGFPWSAPHNSGKISLRYVLSPGFPPGSPQHWYPYGNFSSCLPASYRLCGKTSLQSFPLLPHRIPVPSPPHYNRSPLKGHWISFPPWALYPPHMNVSAPCPHPVFLSFS